MQGLLSNPVLMEKYMDTSIKEGVRLGFIVARNATYQADEMKEDKPTVEDQDSGGE